jgi:hypothetical protein
MPARGCPAAPLRVRRQFATSPAEHASYRWLPVGGEVAEPSALFVHVDCTAASPTAILNV